MANENESAPQTTEETQAAAGPPSATQASPTAQTAPPPSEPLPETSAPAAHVDIPQKVEPVSSDAGGEPTKGKVSPRKSGSPQRKKTSMTKHMDAPGTVADSLTENTQQTSRRSKIDVAKLARNASKCNGLQDMDDRGMFYY